MEPLLPHVSHGVSPPSHTPWSPSSLTCHIESPPSVSHQVRPPSGAHRALPYPSALPPWPWPLSLPPLLTQVPCRTAGDPHRAPVLLESLTRQPARRPAGGDTWRGGADRGPGPSWKPPEQVMQGRGSPRPPRSSPLSSSCLFMPSPRPSWPSEGLLGSGRPSR